MIFYDKEKKELIIPMGIGNTAASSYEEGYNDGRAAQASEDLAKMETLSATTNGEYTPEYGYSKVVVDTEGGEQRWQCTVTGMFSIPAGVTVRANDVLTIIGSNQTWEYIEVDSNPLHDYRDEIASGTHTIKVYLGSSELEGVDFHTTLQMPTIQGTGYVNNIL